MTKPLDPAELAKRLEQRLQARIAKSEGGCHAWIGAKGPQGYGRLTANGVWQPAHRFFYERANGKIPPGLHIDHLCRRRDCVNPDHMEPVTPGENVLRGIGPSARAAKATACKAGHPYEDGAYRIDRRGHRRCLECERRFAREAYRRKHQ